MKAEGIHVGRSLGSKSKKIKLTGKYAQIMRLLREKVPKVQIAKQLGVHRSTLRRFLREMKLQGF